MDTCVVWARADAPQSGRGRDGLHQGMSGRESSPGAAGLAEARLGEPGRQPSPGAAGLGEARLGEPVHREMSGPGVAGQSHVGSGEPAWCRAVAERPTHCTGAGQGGPWDAGRTGSDNFDNLTRTHYPFCMVAEPVIREGLGPSRMAGARGRATGIDAAEKNCSDEVTEKSHLGTEERRRRRAALEASGGQRANRDKGRESRETQEEVQFERGERDVTNAEARMPGSQRSRKQDPLREVSDSRQEGQER